MHTHSRILFRDGREIRGTCESEGYGGQFERRARVFVRARGGVSDVESGKTGGRSIGTCALTRTHKGTHDARSELA